MEVLLVDRAVHPDGSVDEAERDRAGPDRARHDSVLPRPGGVKRTHETARASWPRSASVSVRLAPGRRAAPICDEKTRGHPDDPDRRPRRALHGCGRLLHPVAPGGVVERGGRDRRGLLVRGDHLRAHLRPRGRRRDLRGWKFRALPDDPDDGSPIHGHTGLEIGGPRSRPRSSSRWRSTAPSLAQIQDLPDDHGTINVTSQQFAWSLRIPRSTTERPRARPARGRARHAEPGVERRHPLVLGARVPHEAGRGARSRDASRDHADEGRDVRRDLHGALWGRPLRHALGRLRARPGGLRALARRGRGRRPVQARRGRPRKAAAEVEAEQRR